MSPGVRVPACLATKKSDAPTTCRTVFIREFFHLPLLMGMEASHAPPILPRWGNVFLNAPMVDDFPQQAFALNSK